MKSRTIVASALFLAAALTGCSSSDDEPADSAPAKTTAASNPAAEEKSADDGKAALEDAVTTYTAALFSGDIKGYDYLSARCKKQMPEIEWMTMAKGAHQQYGAQKATGVKVDQLSGDLARVSYGAGNIPQFDREAQSWAREGGTWRWDACPSTG